MLANYLPVLIFLTVATGLALVLMWLGLVIGRWQARAKDDAQKLSPTSAASKPSKTAA